MAFFSLNLIGNSRPLDVNYLWGFNGFRLLGLGHGQSKSSGEAVTYTIAPAILSCFHQHHFLDLCKIVLVVPAPRKKKRRPPIRRRGAGTRPGPSPHPSDSQPMAPGAQDAPSRLINVTLKHRRSSKAGMDHVLNHAAPGARKATEKRPKPPRNGQKNGVCAVKSAATRLTEDRAEVMAQRRSRASDGCASSDPIKYPQGGADQGHQGDTAGDFSGFLSVHWHETG